MKKLAFILNVGVLILVAYELSEKGFPKDLDGFLFVFLFSVTPIVNIFSLVNGTDESWLSLYLRRKALEEKKKIESLSTSPKGVETTQSGSDWH